MTICYNITKENNLVIVYTKYLLNTGIIGAIKKTRTHITKKP
jgi:hypothetical protein